MVLSTNQDETENKSSFRSKNLLSNIETDGIDVQTLRRNLIKNQCRTFVDDYEDLNIALLVGKNSTDCST